MTFLTYYGIMVILSMVLNYFIQGPQRLVDEED